MGHAPRAGEQANYPNYTPNRGRRKDARAQPRPCLRLHGIPGWNCIGRGTAVQGIDAETNIKKAFQEMTLKTSQEGVRAITKRPPIG